MALRPESLRGRIVLAYAAGVVAVVAVATMLAYLLVADRLREAVGDDLRVRLRDLQNQPNGDVGADPYAQLLRAGQVVARSTAAPDGPALDGPQLARALAGHQIVARVPGLRGEALLAADHRPDGTILIVGASLAPIQRAGDHILEGLSAAGAVLAALSAAFVLRLVRSALRPVGALTEEAAAITAAAHGRRLPEPPGDDEIAALARTLNGMLDRLDAAYRREQAFVDDAAHELRTPVAVLRAELELGLAGGPREARPALVAALREADRLGRLATDLLVLARARAGDLRLERHPVDATLQVRTWAGRIAELTGLAVRVDGPEIVASVDPARLEQVVSNLVGNSAQAGAKTLRVDVDDADAGGVTLTFDDDGPGFSPSLLPTAMERFTHEARDTGAGLGLAIVEEIARAHGGSVRASNTSPLGGARVRVVLPGG
jgi:signal transduction histidine kinase